MEIKKYIDFCIFIIYFLSTISFGFYIGLLNYENIYKEEYFDIINIKNSSIITKTSSEITNIFYKQFNNTNFKLYFSDFYYDIIQINIINKILEIDNTNKLPYIFNKEINDCDDFSIILAGNLKKLKYKYKNIWVNLPIGVAFGYNDEIRHSFNIILTYKNITNLYFYCIEPQNDNIFDCKNKKYIINNVYF